MSEDRFWEIVEEVRGGRVVTDEMLGPRLKRMSDEELLGFLTRWRRAEIVLRRHDVRAAATALYGELADQFFDLVVWLVARGREAHSAVLADPAALLRYVPPIEDFDVVHVDVVIADEIESRGLPVVPYVSHLDSFGDPGPPVTEEEALVRFRALHEAPIQDSCIVHGDKLRGPC